MDFTDVLNYYYVNETTTPQQATFKIAKPDIMINQLDQKKMRIQKFYLNNSQIPCFIPDRMVNSDYFNNTVNATTVQIRGNTLTPNSLKYYVVARKQDNSAAVVVFLQQQPFNYGIPTPSHIQTDDNSYYNNKYYYYYDFTNFLSIVSAAFGEATFHMPGGGPLTIPSILANQAGFFSFLTSKVSGDGLYFELSPSLANLLPFKALLTSDNTYRMVLQEPIKVINGVQTYESDAPFYDTVFPFTQLLFRAQEGNLNPQTFIDKGTLSSNVQAGVFEETVLTYDIETNNFLGIYNFYKYIAPYDGLFVNFYSDKNLKEHFVVGLYLRLRNNIIIPYTLGFNEICSFSLEVKYNDKKKA